MEFTAQFCTRALKILRNQPIKFCLFQIRLKLDFSSGARQTRVFFSTPGAFLPTVDDNHRASKPNVFNVWDFKDPNAFKTKFAEYSVS